VRFGRNCSCDSRMSGLLSTILPTHGVSNADEVLNGRHQTSENVRLEYLTRLLNEEDARSDALALVKLVFRDYASHSYLQQRRQFRRAGGSGTNDVHVLQELPPNLLAGVR
jgi:hypothetical protein